VTGGAALARARASRVTRINFHNRSRLMERRFLLSFDSSLSLFARHSSGIPRNRPRHLLDEHVVCALRAKIEFN